MLGVSKLRSTQTSSSTFYDTKDEQCRVSTDILSRPYYWKHNLYCNRCADILPPPKPQRHGFIGYRRESARAACDGPTLERAPQLPNRSVRGVAPRWAGEYWGLLARIWGRLAIRPCELPNRLGHRDGGSVRVLDAAVDDESAAVGIRTWLSRVSHLVAWTLQPDKRVFAPALRSA